MGTDGNEYLAVLLVLLAILLLRILTGLWDHFSPKPTAHERGVCDSRCKDCGE